MFAISETTGVYLQFTRSQICLNRISRFIIPRQFLSNTVVFLLDCIGNYQTRVPLFDTPIVLKTNVALPILALRESILFLASSNMEAFHLCSVGHSLR